jgi:hypothetical protein
LLGDSAELIAAAKVWGVPHAPGYPLYTFLGHLASLLPWGDLALRLNLTSAVYHAIAVGLVSVVAQRLTGSVAGAMGAGLTLIASKSFLLGSLYAEVFPLNDAFFAALIALAIELARSEPERRPNWLLAFALTTSLAAAHHPMLVLAVPALALWVVPAARDVLRRPGWRLAIACALVMPAALLYLSLLWLARRDPVVSFGDVHDLRSLAALVLRTDYGGPLSATLHPSAEPASERIGAFVLLLFGSFGPIGLAAAAIGSLGLVRRDRRSSVALALAVVTTGPLFAAMNRLSVAGEAELAFFERFTTMAHVPIAIWIGVGVSMAVDQIPSGLPARALVELGLATTPGLALVPGLEAVDLSRDRSGQMVVDDLLAGVPPGSLVMVAGDQLTDAVMYLRATDPASENVIVVTPGQLFLPWKRAQLARRRPELDLPPGKITLARSHEIVAREIGRRRVFVAPRLLLKDPVLAEDFTVVPAGLLLRVYPDRTSAEADRAELLSQVRAMADGRRCAGCALDPRDVLRPSQHVHVLLMYSAMLQNASLVALRNGEREAGLALGRRYWMLDRAIGPWMVERARSAGE